MSRLPRKLKVVGTGCTRFSNSPIMGGPGLVCGGVPQTQASRGGCGARYYSGTGWIIGSSDHCRTSCLRQRIDGVGAHHSQGLLSSMRIRSSVGRGARLPLQGRGGRKRTSARCLSRSLYGVGIRSHGLWHRVTPRRAIVWPEQCVELTQPPQRRPPLALRIRIFSRLRNSRACAGAMDICDHTGLMTFVTSLARPQPRRFQCLWSSPARTSAAMPC